MKNLAPKLVRQRCVVEGTTEKIVEPEAIKAYLKELAGVVGTKILSGPYAYPAENMGFGGWVHWVSSGAHFYSYPTNPPLFTVDTYTCCPYDLMDVVAFTKRFLKPRELVWKEVEI